MRPPEIDGVIDQSGWRMTMRSTDSPSAPDASTRLSLAAAYFLCAGLVAIGVASYQIGVLAFGASGASAQGRPITGLVLLGLSGILWLSAGWTLWRRRRIGVALALLAIVVLLARMPFTGTRAAIEFVLLTIAAVAVLTSWREMRA